MTVSKQIVDFIQIGCDITKKSEGIKNMKKTSIVSFLLVLCLMCLCACSKDAVASWQEQYDLGVRYLSEGNYQEAVLAFTAAIEIDPKQADAYLGLADAYMALGDVEQARQILEDALSVVDNPDAIQNRLEGHDGIMALGHKWTAATCSEPETCSECGAIKGETLEHIWKDANYQTPATCAVCEATEGDVLTPDFVTYGIVTDMEIGVHYDYETVTNDNKELKTVGDVVVLDYNVFTSDDTHEAKDGYEWRVVTFQIKFSDNNAQAYGYGLTVIDEDYYNIRLSSDTEVNNDDSNHTSYAVNYCGEDMEVDVYYEIINGGWQADVNTITATASHLVPTGYDGCVSGVRNASDTYDYEYIFDVYSPDDNFHLFRLI